MEVQYNNLYTHFVFTTKGRFPCIAENNRERIEKYITGIVNNHSCKMYAIYANPEHVHFLISRSPETSEQQVATLIADASEIFINNGKLCTGRFYWQQSCSAFSVSKGDIDRVCKYILNQPVHHKKKTFVEEYDQFLKFYQHTLNPNKGIRDEGHPCH
ncbi:MAG: IS200/IS605 family transposase [Prevotellaceae bacterium]|jgi:REP element-mobilizing transposase RayT|nr:IS200/IS605 family transposase [Prevotellaceae bacterium]